MGMKQTISNSQEKLLSIIVPCHNAEKWIAETLNSLIGQTYKNIEILIVDDGSRDNSLDIIKLYKNKDSRIQLFQQKNAGVSMARNSGIEQARGDYVAFCDADDWMEANAYEEMIMSLEKEGADIVFCEFERFWPNGKTQKTIETSFPQLKENPKDIFAFWSSTAALTKDDTLYTKDIHGSACRSVFKRDILMRENIRFCADLKFAEDQIFVLSYLACCKEITYLQKHFMHYRGHTKPWVYHNMFDNHMNLLKEQLLILQKNEYYSDKRKKQIAGYLKCSAYFGIILPELMFKSDAEKRLRIYDKDNNFRQLLTTYNFIQKYKTKREIQRLALFILLKLRMFGLVKKFYKNKKY